MTDDLLQRVVQREAELRRELEELETFRKVHQRLSSTPRSMFSGLGTDKVAPMSPLMGLAGAMPAYVRDTGTGRGLGMVPPSSKRAMIESAAEAVLRQKFPLQTAELLAVLRQRGVEVGGTDEAVNLSSYLSKSARFVNSRRDGGWFLVEQMPQQKLAPQADGQEGHQH